MQSITSPFEPIRAESTAALVARRLRDAIAHGWFRPGQQLIEADLAKQFEVSRGVLREAMQRLTQEGLLISRPNRGLFIASFDSEEIFDIYMARLAIERAACLKVIDVSHRTERLADALDVLTAELERRAAEGAAETELAWLDIEFHERIVAEAESPRLDRMYATLATESRMCVSALEGTAYPVAERISEHHAITDAIRASDVTSLHRLLAEHMDNALAVIRASLAGDDAAVVAG